MSLTLIAVVIALALGHVAPSLAASARDYGWYRHWLRWLDQRFPADGAWRGRFGRPTRAVRCRAPSATT